MKKNKTLFFNILIILIFALISIGLSFLIESVFPNLSSTAANYTFASWDISQYCGMPNYLSLTSIEKFINIIASSLWESSILNFSILIILFLLFYKSNINKIISVSSSIILLLISLLISYFTKNFFFFLFFLVFIPLCYSTFLLIKNKFKICSFLSAVSLFSFLIYLSVFIFILSYLIFAFLSFLALFIYNKYKKKIKFYSISFLYFFAVLFSALLINMPMILSLIEYSSYSSLNLNAISKDIFSLNTFYSNLNFSPEIFNDNVDKQDFRNDSINRSINLGKKITNNNLKNSISGTSKFPLSRYEKFYHYYIDNSVGEINTIKNIIYSAKLNNIPNAQLNEIFSEQANLNISNMLNLSSIYYDADSLPIINTAANSFAFFIDTCIFVKEDEELKSLKYIDTKKQAVVSFQYENIISNQQLEFRDTNATINIVKYSSDEIEYSYRSASKQMLIFSEIYYPKGWTASINGKSIPIHRVNYILRALFMPEGEYSIKFRFEPSSVKIGEYVSLSAVICLLLFSVFNCFKSRKKVIPE